MKFSIEQGERLRRLRRMRKMTQKLVAEKLSYSKTTILLWEKGNPPKSERVLKQLVEDILGGNIDWILHGEEPMLTKPLSKEEQMRSKIPLFSEEERNKKEYPFNQNPITKPGQVSDKGMGFMDEAEEKGFGGAKSENLELLDPKRKSLKEVPLYIISAGPDISFDIENLESTEVFPIDIDDPGAFACKIAGDSMAPEYKPGDVVVFSPKLPYGSGSDVAYRLKDGTNGFKQLRFDEDGLYCFKPINPGYQETKVPRSEIASIVPVYSFSRFPGIPNQNGK